jgi:hypothetical protein
MSMDEEATEIRLTLREIDTTLKSIDRRMKSIDETFKAIDKGIWSLASDFDKWRQHIDE